MAELISIQIINIIQSDLNSSLHFLSYRKYYVVIILCVIGETETELFFFCSPSSPPPVQASRGDIGGPSGITEK